MSPLENPYASGDQLHADFAVVSAAQLDSSRISATKALLGRSGCLGDVLTYYHGVDPTHEVDEVLFNELSILEQQEEMFGRSLVGLHAAEILVASVVDPGLYDRRDSKRVRMLSKEAEWHKILSEKSRGMSTPYDTIGIALDEIAERDLTTAGATTLSMSAEMLSSALTWWQIAKIKIYKSDRESYVEDIQLRSILDTSETALAASALAVQDMVKQKTIGEARPDLDPAERLERAALGLKAQWRSGAILMHPMLRYAEPEQAHATLGDMIDTLQKEFIDGDLLDTSKYPRNVIKGLLHELIWLVDAQMIMLSNPADYQTIHVGPSATRLDRPIIGRPVLIRGIDYAIRDFGNEDSKTLLINLKSGNGDTRDYHPRVKTVKEANFQDVGYGRLANKLNQYQKILKSGFSLQDTCDIVEKYALRTVKDELALHKNSSLSDGWPYILPIDTK